ncbi:MAG: hypothetical protein ACP5OY_07020 [Halothiobacillaceae bacterium]
MNIAVRVDIAVAEAWRCYQAVEKFFSTAWEGKPWMACTNINHLT